MKHQLLIFHPSAHDEMLGGWVQLLIRHQWSGCRRCSDGSATHSGMHIPPNTPSIEPHYIPAVHKHLSTRQLCQRSSHWDVALVPVCVCGNGTFLEIKFRAWAYLTSMLLVLAASSLRMEYMSEIASRPDRWRSSEYNEYLDICISRSASSTSLWATVSENLSLAKACNKQATSCSDRDILHVSITGKRKDNKVEIYLQLKCGVCWGVFW